MSIKKMDIDAVAMAIEADAGEALPDLRQALNEGKAGMTGRLTRGLVMYKFTENISDLVGIEDDEFWRDKRRRQEEDREAVLSGRVKQTDLFWFSEEFMKRVTITYKE